MTYKGLFFLCAAAACSALLVCRLRDSTPRLRPVEAKRTPQSSIAYSFQLPAAVPSVVHVGTVPNPTSISTSAESSAAIVLTFFEATAQKVALRVIDKQTMTPRTCVLEGAYIAHKILPDVSDPDRFWVATSGKAELFELNSATLEVKKQLEIPGEQYVFALEQGQDGTVYLGTWPGARCFQIKPGQGEVTSSEITIARDLIGTRTYLRDIFVDDNQLLLHYASPALLLRHDLRTQRTEELARGSMAFFPEADIAKHLPRAIDSGKPKAAGFEVKTSGLEAVVTCQGKTAALSLLGLKTGMPLCAFAGAEEGLIVGDTYWTRWLYVVDTNRHTVTGLGEAGACGEFAAACPYRGEIALPHYHGQLYLFDPRKPFVHHSEKTPNPRPVIQVPDAHLGTCCLEGKDGCLYYATLPNYHKDHGMIVKYAPETGARVFANPDRLTFGQLVLAEDRLYAGTMYACGLGVGGSQAGPARVVAFSTTGELLGSVVLQPETTSPIMGLIELEDQRLLAGTQDGNLYQVEWQGTELTSQLVGHTPGLAALVRYGTGPILAVAWERLFTWVPGGNPEPLCRLPPALHRLALMPDGSLYFAGASDIFCMPAGSIDQLLKERPWQPLRQFLIAFTISALGFTALAGIWRWGRNRKIGARSRSGTAVPGNPEAQPRAA